MMSAQKWPKTARTLIILWQRALWVRRRLTQRGEVAPLGCWECDRLMLTAFSSFCPTINQTKNKITVRVISIALSAVSSLFLKLLTDFLLTCYQCKVCISAHTAGLFFCSVFIFTTLYQATQCSPATFCPSVLGIQSGNKIDKIDQNEPNQISCSL